MRPRKTPDDASALRGASRFTGTREQWRVVDALRWYDRYPVEVGGRVLEFMAPAKDVWFGPHFFWGRYNREHAALQS